MLGYCVTLSPRKRGRDPPTVCNTTHTQCNFSAPAGTRRVYLSAYNAAGESAPTEVILLERKGEDSANFPQSETSICPPGALYPPSPPQQLHKLSNWMPFHHPTAGETLPWVCNWGAPEQGRLQAGGQRRVMQQGCSPSRHPGWLSPCRSAPGWAPGHAQGRAQPLGALGGTADPGGCLRPGVAAGVLGARSLQCLLADGA